LPLFFSTYYRTRPTGEALWHEDIHDPGDMSKINVKLKRDGDTLEFSFYVDGDPASERPTLVYRREGS
jgi:hypothetical protein